MTEPRPEPHDPHDPQDPQDPHDAVSRVGRRRLFQGAAGGVAVGALFGAGGAWAVERDGAGRADGGALGDLSDRDVVDLTTSYPFYDQAHPAGVATPPQRYAVFMTFSMLPGTTRSDLQILLARWSAAIAQLMAGRPIGQIESTRADTVGQDTGEAAGLDPASLTVTVGLGPGLFDDRFGLAGRRPALLEPLPDLPSDSLDPGLTGGDLSVQACADDPQVAYHAVRNLARMVRTTARTGWAVLGFGRASAGSGQETPRNLLGFKDGTRNIVDDADLDEFVWLRDADWMTGGSYQVVRKISMDIEIWDADPVDDQQQIFGRTKSVGAPLTGREEHDTPDFAAVGADDQPVIAPISHVALAAHENNGGTKILRRSYNFTDGINEFGQLDAGLLFVAYVNDPEHFITLQRRLGSSDRLNEYIKHLGSGLFAVPPAPATGRYLAQDMFG